MKKAQYCKLPETVIIGGRQWKVLRDPTLEGASFDATVPCITVGDMSSRGEEGINFLHEIIEAVLDERKLCYQKPFGEISNGDYLFVFTHAEFEEAVKDIYLALSSVLRL